MSVYSTLALPYGVVLRAASQNPSIAGGNRTTMYRVAEPRRGRVRCKEMFCISMYFGKFVLPAHLIRHKSVPKSRFVPPSPKGKAL